MKYSICSDMDTIDRTVWYYRIYIHSLVMSVLQHTDEQWWWSVKVCSYLLRGSERDFNYAYMLVNDAYTCACDSYKCSTLRYSKYITGKCMTHLSAYSILSLKTFTLKIICSKRRSLIFTSPHDNWSLLLVLRQWTNWIQHNQYIVCPKYMYSYTSF
jgi:hypothetical protein